MRFARVRRLLGPLEPVALDAYRHLQAWADRWRRPAVVVVAVDGPHLQTAADLGDDLGGDLGFWLTASDEVDEYGTLGWFVIRLESASWTEEALTTRIEALDEILRVRRVIDLRD